MNNERIEFALKILAWEVDAARKRLERRKKKLQEDGEITAHLYALEGHTKTLKSHLNEFRKTAKGLQRIEDKEAANMKWRRGKDPRNVAGRNQMILAYGRKRSS